MNSMLTEILFDASYTFILVGTFIALIFGLGLLLAPTKTLKFNEKINTRFSMRKATKKIETSIKSEPLFYKYSKFSGTLLMLGSLFILYKLFTFNAYPIIPYLPKTISPMIWEWVIDSAQIFFYLSCAFIFTFGLIVFIRPSLVKNFEKIANHWISTRKTFYKMSTDINITNKLVSAYPRFFGFSITISALIVFYFLLPQY